MKIQISSLHSGTPRIVKGLVAAFGLVAATTAIALPSATVGVVLSTSSLSSGSSLRVDSGDRLIHESKSYKYTLSAKIKGEAGTPMSAIIPKEISLADYLESLSKGSSSLLTRTVDDLDGKHSTSLFKQPFLARKNVKGFGKVTVAFTLSGKISKDGQVALAVEDFVFKSSTQGSISGKIKFGKGSKLSVTAAPLVTFSKPKISASESKGVVTISVVREVNYLGTVKVDYATADGTGNSSDHYVTKSGTLTFAPGETKKSIDITLPDNELADGSRNFAVNLSNVKGSGFTGRYPSLIVTIKNND